MRAVKISLDDEDVALLELSAGTAGRSFSEEARIRLHDSLHGPMAWAPDTADLLKTIARLTRLVEEQTKRPWHSHPAAIRLLQDAIIAKLERMRGGAKDAEFTLDELPADARATALVGAADQRAWGSALEAIDFHTHHRPVRVVPDDEIPPF